LSFPFAPAIVGMITANDLYRAIQVAATLVLRRDGNYGSAALLDSNRKVHLAWREYCPDVRGVSRACRVVRDCADLTAVSHGADQIYRHVRRLPAGACNHYG